MRADSFFSPLCCHLAAQKDTMALLLLLPRSGGISKHRPPGDQFQGAAYTWGLIFFSFWSSKNPGAAYTWERFVHGTIRYFKLFISNNMTDMRHKISKLLFET